MWMQKNVKLNVTDFDGFKKKRKKKLLKMSKLQIF